MNGKNYSRVKKVRGKQHGCRRIPTISLASFACWLLRWPHFCATLCLSGRTFECKARVSWSLYIRVLGLTIVHCHTSLVADRRPWKTCPRWHWASIYLSCPVGLVPCSRHCPVRLTVTILSVRPSASLTYCVLRSTQPPTLSGMGNE